MSLEPSSWLPTLLKRVADNDNSSYNQLVENGTEMVYHLDRYFPYQRLNVRALTIASSSASILAGLIFFYFFFMIHPSSRSFRHQLIFGLISYDFLKALVLLIFAGTVQSTNESASRNNHFVAALGWLTSFSIEGADLMILYFALHISLVIFKPTSFMFKWLNKASVNSAEGGLYPIRHVIFALAFIIPVILSSVVFAEGKGYYDNINMSYYKPLSIVWYVTWIMRWAIYLIILFIYASVYFHVMSEYKKVSSGLKKVGGTEKRGMVQDLWSDSLWYKVSKLLLMLVFPDIQISAKLHGRDLDTDTDIANLHYYNSSRTSMNMHSDDPADVKMAQLATIMSPSGEPLPTIPSASEQSERANEQPLQQIQGINIANIGMDVQNALHRDAMEKFNTRRLQILRQMKVIFIYPLSFMMLWLFPFVLCCYSMYNGSGGFHHAWCYYCVGVSQGINCFIDTIVFIIRETPWRLTSERMDPNGDYETYSNLSRRLQFLPGYKIPNQSNLADIEAYKHIQNELDSMDMSSIVRAPESAFNISTTTPTTAVNFIRRNSAIDPMNDEEDADLSLADFLKYTGPKTPHTTQMHFDEENSTVGPGMEHRRPSKLSWKGAFSMKGSISEKSRMQSVNSTASSKISSHTQGTHSNNLHLSYIEEQHQKQQQQQDIPKPMEKQHKAGNIPSPPPVFKKNWYFRKMSGGTSSSSNNQGTSVSSGSATSSGTSTSAFKTDEDDDDLDIFDILKMGPKGS